MTMFIGIGLYLRLSAPAHIVIMFNLALSCRDMQAQPFLLQGLQRRSKLNRGTFSQ